MELQQPEACTAAPRDESADVAPEFYLKNQNDKGLRLRLHLGVEG